MVKRRTRKLPPPLELWKADWDADTEVLTPAAAGGWIRILLYLHVHDPRGRAVHDLPGWANIIRCQPAEAGAILAELSRTKCAEVRTRALRRNAKVTPSNRRVTVINRRMERERKEATQNALRQNRHRGKRQSNAGVTRPSSHSSFPPPPLPPPNDEGGGGVKGLTEEEVAAVQQAWSEAVGSAGCDTGAAARLSAQFGLDVVVASIKPAFIRWKKEGWDPQTRKRAPFTWGWVKTQIQQPKKRAMA